MPGSTPKHFVPDPETMYEREDMRSVTVWMMKGARPVLPDEKLMRPHGLLLLMQACWALEPSERPTFAEIVRVLTTLTKLSASNPTDALLQPPHKPEPEPEPEKPTTARDWLVALGYLGDVQIDEAVAYTQEEGAPTALLEMDAEDFEEMIEEMALKEDEERFRASVKTITALPRPSKAEHRDDKVEVGQKEQPWQVLVRKMGGQEEEASEAVQQLRLDLQAERNAKEAALAEVAALREQLRVLGGTTIEEGAPPA